MRITTSELINGVQKLPSDALPLAHAERQHRAWRPAVVARLAPTFGLMNPLYIAALAASIAVLPALAQTDWQISTRGYGHVQAGMLPLEAARLMGTRLRTQEGRPIESSCDYLYPEKGFKGVSLMVERGKVAHIQVTDPTARTRSGAAVGDSMEKLRKLYGSQLEVQQHKYDETGFYYFVWEQDRRHGVKFEIAGGRVVSIYAGDYTIGYVEGCA